MLPSLLWNSQRAWDECAQSARERREKCFPLRSVETRLSKINPTRRSGAEVSQFRGTCQKPTSSHLEWQTGPVLRLSGT